MNPAWRTRAGAIGAPLTFAILWVADLGLEPKAHHLAAVFGAILVLWLSEAIPIAASALLIAPLLVVTDICAPAEAFKHYADPLLFLFIGGFFIAEAMTVHGLDRRIAKAILTMRSVDGRPGRTRVALTVVGFLLSMWISNTGATAILVPILLRLHRAPARGEKSSTIPAAEAGGLLALAYSCSIGGLGTLVGSPPNLITLRNLNEGERAFGFLEWTMVGLPTALALFGLIYLVTSRMFRAPQTENQTALSPEDLFPDVPERWTRGEITTAVSFGLAVVGWLLPGAAQALDLEITPTLKALLPSGVVAIVASSILFAVPDGAGKRVLSWEQAARIDWGVILLFGGGIALGTQLVETGLAAALSHGFVSLSGIESLWPLVAFACVFTIFFTEICSNTASATMLVPLVIAIAVELGVSPVPPALAVGLAASCAFMLPIATGPNAIVYSTGRVTQGQMIRAGLWLNVLGSVVVFVMLRVLCPAYGWT
ncbi:MAG: DASS family sodium-coupled anion symporter [Sandaracinaceae bacterium]